MPELNELLMQTEIFTGLDKELLNKLISCGYMQHYEKGEYLLRPLEKLDKLGLVVKGKLRLVHIFPNGNYSLMETSTDGKLIGLDLVSTKTRVSPYHIQAATDSSVFWIPAAVLSGTECFDEKLRSVFLERMLSELADINMKKEYRLAILSQKGLRERIVSFLTMQANRLQKTSFRISFSREEMASFLCVNRSALSHELSVMQREGLLSFDESYFTLNDWELDF